MSTLGQNFEETSNRAQEIIADLKRGQQKRVTLDLSPLEVYAIECIRFNGERSDSTLALLAFQLLAIMQKRGQARPLFRLVLGGAHGPY